jgi:hypothetical protein
VTWTLVFDDGQGRWHIDKAGPNNSVVRISLAEFERTDHGRQLKEQLSGALRAAELDG